MRNPGPFSSRLFWPLVRALIGILILGVTAVPRTAFAMGTVNIANLSPTEDDNGRWKLKMSINYGSTPHLGHIPMIFSFTPTVLYERALTDQTGDKPVLNRIPLANQQGIHESMDVGFMDAGTGKVYSTTKFDFVIRRDRGFEAGEYTLVIKTSDGVTMGQPQRLKLLGDNPVVDRRAIVFSGEKKKVKKEETKEGGEDAKEGEEKKEEAKSEEPAEPAMEKVGESSAEGTPTEAPPEVAPKQGGCGCRLVGAAEDGSVGSTGMSGLAWIAPFALALARRRRTARGSSRRSLAA